MVKIHCLVLMGMKHCGKTTLGRLLAKNRNLPFFDLDHTMMEIYNSDMRISIREIFQRIGKAEFQNLEVQGVMHILASIREKEAGNITAVCSLGGGTIENEKALSAFPLSSTFCYIREAEKTLLTRILRGGVPAFLDKDRPSRDFHRIYTQRTPLYEKKADIILDGKGQDVEPLYKELLQVLQEEGCVS